MANSVTASTLASTVLGRRSTPNTFPVSRIKCPKYPRLSLGASTLSRCYGVRESNYFTLDRPSPPYTHEEKVSEDKKYTLDDVRKVVGLSPVPRDANEPIVPCEWSAKECLEKYLSGTEVCQCVVDETIPVAETLPSLASNSFESPDVILYSDNFSSIVTTFEVLSSSMEFCVHKAVLGAANIIRLLRCTNVMVSSFTSFTFPSTTSASVIVKVTVTWKKLRFVVHLTYYEILEEGLQAIKEIYDNSKVVSPTILPVKASPTLIEIHPSELLFLGLPNCTPILSPRHIMFQSTGEDGNTFIYKVLYDLYEKNFFIDTHEVHLGTRFVRRFKYHVRGLSYIIYYYKKVAHKPLTVELAYDCIKDLVLSIGEALEELHSCCLRHNDLRLPNVCFNSEYKAVLIDLDACCYAEERHPFFSAAKSCMYKTHHLPPDGNTDYMQLGWLVVNVLNPTDDEHCREYNDIPEFIKESNFVSQLILEGKWDNKSFQSFQLGGSMTLKNAIMSNV